MSRLIKLLFVAGIGVAAIRFRHEIRERVAIAAGKAKGAVATATPSPASEAVDDKTLAHKVETEIFRAPDAPKGDVSVDVQAGVVNLRGEVADDQWISRLADEASHVDGIKGVNNLLHSPGTPAPAAEPRGTVTDRAS